MAEPTDLPFGLLTQVGRRKHKFNRIRQGECAADGSRGSTIEIGLLVGWLV